MGGILSAFVGSILSSLPKNRRQIQHQNDDHNRRKMKVVVVDQKSRQPVQISRLSIAEGEDTMYTINYGPRATLIPLSGCHGMYISTMSQKRLAIWNPTSSSSNKIKTIPQSSVPRPPHMKYELALTYGFGFDPSSNDYKVIRFLKFYFKDGKNKSIRLVELYSLKTNSWKQIAYPHDNVVGYGMEYICVYTNNGFCYTRASGDINRLVIIPFDLANEKFPPQLIPGPPNSCNKSCFLLVVFEGSQLAVIAYQRKPFEFELWVWNNESWSLRGAWAIHGDTDGYRPVGQFFNNGVCFLQNYSKDELFLFDCAKQTMKFLGVYDPFVYVIPCVENKSPDIK